MLKPVTTVMPRQPVGPRPLYSGLFLEPAGLPPVQDDDEGQDDTYEAIDR